MELGTSTWIKICFNHVFSCTCIHCTMKITHCMYKEKTSVHCTCVYVTCDKDCVVVCMQPLLGNQSTNYMEIKYVCSVYLHVDSIQNSQPMWGAQKKGSTGIILPHIVFPWISCDLFSSFWVSHGHSFLFSLPFLFSYLFLTSLPHLLPNPVHHCHFLLPSRALHQPPCSDSYCMWTGPGGSFSLSLLEAVLGALEE